MSASVVVAKSAAWRRGTTQTSNGEGEAGLVLPDHPSPIPRLLAGEPAIRTLALANQIASGAADLLGNSMRYLGQVVQVETKVVGPSACLSSPVLDDLEILCLLYTSPSPRD